MELSRCDARVVFESRNPRVKMGYGPMRVRWRMQGGRHYELFARPGAWGYVVRCIARQSFVVAGCTPIEFDLANGMHMALFATLSGRLCMVISHNFFSPKPKTKE
jgi:hypothetical protein